MNRPNCMIFRLALAALLLFAQHMAVAHESAHAFDRGPSQSRHSGDKGNFHSDLCVFHGDFASILGAVKSAPPILQLSDAAFERPAEPPFRRHDAQPVSPASRGPPFASPL